MRRRYFERTVVSSLGAGDSLTRAADLGPRASALGCLALTVAALHRPRTGEVERAERPVTHQASFSVTGTHQTARCRGGPTGTTLGKPCGPMGGGDDEIGGCGERQLAMAVPARRSTTTTIGVGAWARGPSLRAFRHYGLNIVRRHLHVVARTVAIQAQKGSPWQCRDPPLSERMR